MKLDFEHSDSGLVFATSPDILGLLIAGHSEEECRAQLPSALYELLRANLDGRNADKAALAAAEARVAELEKVARLYVTHAWKVGYRDKAGLCITETPFHEAMLAALAPPEAQP